jgi:hypothetical protein
MPEKKSSVANQGQKPILPGLDIPENNLWNHRFFLLLTILFCWRLAFLALAPLDLVSDEAYYWDWSRRLDWGYFSKPPLIAWLNALSTTLFGNSVFAVRLPAVCFSVVSAWAIFALARHLFSARIAFWAVLAAIASPGSCALGFLMTIDAPLVCCWSLAAYWSWRAMEEPGRLRWWLLTTLAIGFGALSKQMMLVFLVLWLLFLATSPQDRATFRNPRLYLTIFLTLCFLLPPLWWNMQNGWITFVHTGHHFSGNPGKPFFFVKTAGDFLGGQLLLLSPVTWILFVTAACCLVIGFRRQPRAVRWLLLLSIVPLLVVAMMSLRQRINANWPAAFYPAGLALVAAWALGEVSCGKTVDRLRRFFVPGVGVGALFFVLTYGLIFGIQWTPMGGSRQDPLARLTGWRHFGEEIGYVVNGLPNGKKTFLLTVYREFTSELAFYAPGNPVVYLWPSPDGLIDNQYDLWPGPLQKMGWDALVVIKAGVEPPPAMKECFASFEFLGEKEIVLGPGGQRQYRLYLGRHLQKWPR